MARDIERLIELSIRRLLVPFLMLVSVDRRFEMASLNAANSAVSFRVDLIPSHSLT